MRTARAAFLALLVLLLASTASAGMLTVTYDLNGNGAGFLFNGPATGVLTLTLPASSPTVVDPSGTAAALDSFVIQSTGGATILSTGFLTLSLSVSPAGNAFQGFVSGIAFTFGQVNLTVFDFASGSIAATASFGMFTGTGTSISSQFFSFNGSEISRSFVPEPGAATLLAAGVLGIGLAGGSGAAIRRRFKS